MKRTVRAGALTIPLIAAVALIATMPAIVTPVMADLFQYIDQDGTVVMVDDEGKIPARYRKQTKTTKGSLAGGSKVTPVRMRDSQAFVPVRLSYRNASVDALLLLDTGAAITVISPDLAGRLGIRPESTKKKLAQVADGRVVETFRTHIDSLDVGPRQKFNLEVAVMPISGPISGFDGLLGMNFLEGLRYHIDVNAQTIEWQ